MVRTTCVAPEMSMPARSSSPPRLAKAFCMSTTITADSPNVTSMGSGRVASLGIGHHGCPVFFRSGSLHRAPLGAIVPRSPLALPGCGAMIGARRSPRLTEHGCAYQGGNHDTFEGVSDLGRP